MTVKQLFYACDNFQYEDVVTIIDANKVLYKSIFADVLTTVYAEYTVRHFNYEIMHIQVL
mgnify:CR=1 FL=1